MRRKMPRQPASQTARKILRDRYGTLPWPCYLCDDPIREKPHVHHIDGNHGNDNPENLAAVHLLCHNRHHQPWKYITDDGRRRLSEAAIKNRPWTYPNPGHTGHTHSAASRKKMSESLKGNHKGWSWVLNENGKRVWIERKEANA